jgi:hypothetical protein
LKKIGKTAAPQILAFIKTADVERGTKAAIAMRIIFNDDVAYSAYLKEHSGNLSPDAKMALLTAGMDR